MIDLKKFESSDVTGYSAIVSYDRTNGEIKHRQIISSAKAIVDSDFLHNEPGDNKIDEAFDFYSHESLATILHKKTV